MLTFQEFTQNALQEAAIPADKISGFAEEAVEYLKKELQAILPSEQWEVKVWTDKSLPSITVRFYDRTSENVKVTWHNAKVSGQFMMHLMSKSGKLVDITDKVSFEEIGGSRLKSAGVKFRKISDATIMGASKKLVEFVRKNKNALETAITK